jgi:phenylalanyl-tRNA synthetase alpha chain
MDIKFQIAGLRDNALNELNAISQSKDLETWRVRYLGKKSHLTELLRSLSGLPIEERKEAGALSNTLKLEMEAALTAKEEVLKQQELTSVSNAGLDTSLPGRPYPQGHLHLMSQAIYEISDIFAGMGFQVVEGPEVEWDHYNFDALNIPKEHPARDNMATFWVDAPPQQTTDWRMLLRTHTSPMQVRTMEKTRPPVRIIVPGRVYRYEATDATHLAMFTQIEGLAVDEGITMADLKGTLYEFARRFFGIDRKVRFRCDFFPFVEPGAEMAISCAVCKGSGCRLCGNSGWIEILGAGMVHPSVLEGVGIDSAKYSGFAFGMGIERIPMLRYGIEDVRHFYSGDLRFLRQF